VNRDDDLDGGGAMSELFDWNEACLAQRLSKIENPPVQDLLGKLLARDPKNRPASMKEVLAHDFFVDCGASHGDIKEIRASLSRVEASQAQLVTMSESTMKLVETSTSKLCTAIFEATEVATPTCFAILPYELPAPKVKLGKEEQESMFLEAEEWADTVAGLAEEGTGVIKSRAQYARSFFGSAFKDKIAKVKSKFVEKSMYLYLVDEFTGKPVHDESGVYPVKIDVNSELLEKYLPMMRIGLQAASIANGVAAYANVFFSFVPSTLVPEGLLSKVKGFVDDRSKSSNVGNFSSVQNEVEEGGGEGEAKTKRGGELRDFEKFLVKHDEDRMYAGLRRVCNKENGHAIWVSEESAREIETGGSDVVRKLEQREKELAKEVEYLKARLEEAECKTPGAVARLRSEVTAAPAIATAALGDSRQGTESKLDVTRPAVR